MRSKLICLRPSGSTPPNFVRKRGMNSGSCAAAAAAVSSARVTILQAPCQMMIIRQQFFAVAMPHDRIFWISTLGSLMWQRGQTSREPLVKTISLRFCGEVSAASNNCHSLVHLFR